MRGVLLLVLAGGCGGQTGEMDFVGNREVVETPLALDEVSPLGFTPQEVLDQAPTTAYDAALTAADGDFGPGSWSDQLAQSGPFTISALMEPEAVFRQEYLNGTLLRDSVAVNGQITVVSADGAFVVAGAVELVAVDPALVVVGWGDTEGLTGTMPTWVDDALAEAAVAMDCTRPPEDPEPVIQPLGELASLELILNFVLEPCGSGNYAAIDLTPVE